MASARLKVLCWNAHLFGRSVTSGMAHEDERRADAVAQHVVESGCDVVGLVEVWERRLVERLRARLEGDYPYVAHGPVVNRTGLLATVAAALVLAGAAAGWWLARWGGLWVGGQVLGGVAGALVAAVAAVRVASGVKALGSGLLLFSRVPFREGPRFNPFLHVTFRARSPDFLALKGVLRVPLEGDVDVYLAHTQAQEGEVQRRVRLGQVGEIGARIERVSERARRHDEVVPVAIVMGDLNVTAEGRDGEASVEYAEMMKQLPGGHDAWLEANGGRPAEAGITWAVDNPLVRRFAPGETRSRRLDYVIWCAPGGQRVGAKTAEVARWATSDHWALWAELEIEARSGGAGGA